MSSRILLASVLTACLLVAGIGAVTTQTRESPQTSGIAEPSLSRGGSDGEALARLENYTQSIEAPQSARTPAAGDLLPDVDTMIQRLAARLEAAPTDIKGWRMLGWSYSQTGRYEQAAAAYGKAVELDPNSAEIKQSYEQAKANASELGAKGNTQPKAASPDMGTAEVRSMVEGLADRLEKSPRDLEGWTRLMRSQIVLGERTVAATALRKALEVFKDDAAASEKIKAAAIELGLKND